MVNVSKEAEFSYYELFDKMSDIISTVDKLFHVTAVQWNIWHWNEVKDRWVQIMKVWSFDGKCLNISWYFSYIILFDLLYVQLSFWYV